MRSAGTIVVLLLAVCVSFIRCQAVGESCFLQATSQSGVCRLITQCPSAIQLLQQRIPPQLCGFQGGSTATIVCCGGAAPVVTTTTTTARTTTTTRSTSRIPSITTTRTTTRTTTAARLTGAVGEKSLLKCKEYGEHVYFNEAASAFSNNAFDRKADCVIDAETLITGGKKALLKEFPHMALLGYEGANGPVYKCGGTLISEDYVLTAAHCLYDRETASYVRHVRLGDLDISSDSDGARPQNMLVAQYTRHPSYKPPSKYNDIALLRLETRPILSPFVRPACLHTKKEVGRTHVVATGWGRTDFTGDTSNHLLKVLLDVYSNGQCNESYEVDRTLATGILNTQVCAGSFNDTKDACQGDSGGPLQISNTQSVYCTYNIVGVTSFGKACGIVNQPGVYTRVYEYLPWIESIVWP